MALWEEAGVSGWSRHHRACPFAGRVCVCELVCREEEAFGVPEPALRDGVTQPWVKVAEL